MIIHLKTKTLAHWGRVTHICVSELTTIGSDNGLSPGRHQAKIWTSAGILWIGPLGTSLSENVIGIKTFSFKKMHLKMSSVKWRPFRLGPNVLNVDCRGKSLYLAWRRYLQQENYLIYGVTFISKVIMIMLYIHIVITYISVSHHWVVYGDIIHQHRPCTPQHR